MLIAAPATVVRPPACAPTLLPTAPACALPPGPEDPLAPGAANAARVESLRPRPRDTPSWRVLRRPAIHRNLPRSAESATAFSNAASRFPPRDERVRVANIQSSTPQYPRCLCIKAAFPAHISVSPSGSVPAHNLIFDNAARAGVFLLPITRNHSRRDPDDQKMALHECSRRIARATG